MSAMAAARQTIVNLNEVIRATKFRITFSDCDDETNFTNPEEKAKFVARGDSA